MRDYREIVFNTHIHTYRHTHRHPYIIKLYIHLGLPQSICICETNASVKFVFMLMSRCEKAANTFLLLLSSNRKSC